MSIRTRIPLIDINTMEKAEWVPLTNYASRDAVADRAPKFHAQSSAIVDDDCRCVEVAIITAGIYQQRSRLGPRNEADLWGIVCSLPGSHRAVFRWFVRSQGLESASIEAHLRRSLNTKTRCGMVDTPAQPS